MHTMHQPAVVADEAHFKRLESRLDNSCDVYFSADIETDGPIPGPYSMLSFAMVYAGTFDGKRFTRPAAYDQIFYQELRPISETFQEEALRVNGLDRASLVTKGQDPRRAMTSAADWIVRLAGPGRPVLVAYPVSFDWAWLYWYFVQFSESGSPFKHSQCFDIKTALAVKLGLPIHKAGKSHLPDVVESTYVHSHNALEDAIEQADIFGNVFEMEMTGAGPD